MEIRDTRNGEWHWVNNAVIACPHITSAEKVVYSALCTFAGCKEIRPDFNLISQRASVSPRTAKLSIKKLIEVGYVEKSIGGGRGQTNVYKLLKVPKGCKICTVSKGCKILPETVQISPLNGAKSAPQLDNEVDKEKDLDFAFAKSPSSEEFVDEDGNPLPQLKRRSSPPKNKEAHRLQDMFRELVRKNLKKEIIWDKKNYFVICDALKFITIPQAEEMIKDWFNEPRKDDDLISLPKCFSHNQINLYKLHH